jgi:hypothetical protein
MEGKLACRTNDDLSSLSNGLTPSNKIDDGKGDRRGDDDEAHDRDSYKRAAKKPISERASKMGGKGKKRTDRETGTLRLGAVEGFDRSPRLVGPARAGETDVVHSADAVDNTERGDER